MDKWTKLWELLNDEYTELLELAAEEVGQKDYERAATYYKGANSLEYILDLMAEMDGEEDGE